MHTKTNPQHRTFRSIRRKAVVLLTVVSLLFNLTACNSSDKSAEATKMQLTKIKGTVKVTDDKDKDIKVFEEMGLFDGYGITTKKTSYAEFILDTHKFIGLDESSHVNIEKNGSKLKLSLSDGSLAFNVTKKLRDSERLDIETGNMTFGIRGTKGVVQCISPTETVISLVSGEIEGTASGSDFALYAGQCVDINTATDGTVSFEYYVLEEDDLPDFSDRIISMEDDSDNTPIEPTNGASDENTDVTDADTNETESATEESTTEEITTEAGNGPVSYKPDSVVTPEGFGDYGFAEYTVPDGYSVVAGNPYMLVLKKGSADDYMNIPSYEIRNPQGENIVPANEYDGKYLPPSYEIAALSDLNTMRFYRGSELITEMNDYSGSEYSTISPNGVVISFNANSDEEYFITRTDLRHNEAIQIPYSFFGGYEYDYDDQIFLTEEVDGTFIFSSLYYGTHMFDSNGNYTRTLAYGTEDPDESGANDIYYPTVVASNISYNYMTVTDGSMYSPDVFGIMDTDGNKFVISKADLLGEQSGSISLVNYKWNCKNVGTRLLVTSTVYADEYDDYGTKEYYLLDFANVRQYETSYSDPRIHYTTNAEALIVARSSNLVMYDNGDYLDVENAGYSKAVIGSFSLELEEGIAVLKLNGETIETCGGATAVYAHNGVFTYDGADGQSHVVIVE